MEEKTLYDKIKVKTIWEGLENLSKVILVTGIVAFLAVFISALSIHLSPLIHKISILLGSSISLDLNFTTLVDFLSNSLFISVTVVYVMATYRIVETTKDSIKQNQESREIEFIEKRLEQFYMPLHNFLTAYISIRSKDNVNELIVNNELYQYDKRLQNSLYKDIVYHKYLVLPKTNPYFNHFLEIGMKQRNSSNPEVIKSYHDLMDEIDTDIKKLQLQLDERIDT
jgi:hypothetical protein